MTQNNFRKEPFFGEPSVPVSEENSSVDATPEAPIQKPYVSLRSTQSPGHTFTPIMKRPEPAAEPVVQTMETAVEQAADVVKPAKEFQFTPMSSDVAEPVKLEVEPVVSRLNTVNADVNEKVEGEKVEADEAKTASQGFTTERIIPNVAATAAGATVSAAAAVKVSTIKAKMPAKSRRLLLVGLLALALLVLFFLLRPSTPETVEELQAQQGNSLPIEFRPVDEAEAKRAEEQARAEQEAALKVQEQQAQQAQEPQNQEPQTQNVIQTSPVQNEPMVAEQAPTLGAKPVEPKVVVNKPVVKPQTEGSVVYQPETTAKPQVKPQSKEVVKPQPQKEPAKVVKAVEKAPAKPVIESVKAAPASVATKTMTVPKGVSLMQVFRDNNLNISDVNAMSKVNNVVSNLKVGERVTVRLDKNNRVVEMSIGSGGKFTRQANGSYTFK